MVLPLSSRPAQPLDTMNGARGSSAPGFLCEMGVFFVLLNAVVRLTISSARWKISTSRSLCSRSFLLLAGGTWSELCSGEALGSRAVQSPC